MCKVSVIIPAYNAMRFLPETLKSVIDQTFEDFEVIIIDDGSTDNTVEWAKGNVDPRVKVISQANQGASNARNNGIRNAQGEYIAFLDADDLWESSKLAKQVAMLDSNPNAGLVYTWVVSIDQNGLPRGRTYRNLAEGQVWQTLIQHNIIECGSTPLVRRSCFEQVGLFDESLTNIEDRDMWLRIACHYDFLVVKEALVYYRQHPNSKGKNYKRVEKSALALLEKAFNSPPADITTDELEKLKAKSYAMTYLRLAWKPLKSQLRDHEAALEYYKKAVAYDRNIIFRKDFWRLTLAVRLMQYLGTKNYDKLMLLIYQLRRRFIATSA